jgi:hypothetical protein
MMAAARRRDPRSEAVWPVDELDICVIVSPLKPLTCTKA